MSEQAKPMSLNAKTDDVLVLFAGLKVWERRGERAPHKPLLALLALGRWANGNRGPYPFASIEGPLRALLAEFGPPRKSFHPEFPFWYLKNDGVWEVEPDDGYPPRKGHSSPSAAQLRDRGAVGRFAPAVAVTLTHSPELVPVIAHTLLTAHFPPTYHDDLLSAVGLDLVDVAPTAVRRDPAFREAVLVAYGYACAVCGFGVRLGNTPVGVEAAHIRWHAEGGPDEVTNGLCLCPLHHKLFDRGAITLSPDAARVWVSNLTNGPNADAAVHRFHDQPVAPPSRTDARPRAAFVAWHHKEVFRGQPRG